MNESTNKQMRGHTKTKLTIWIDDVWVVGGSQFQQKYAMFQVNRQVVREHNYWTYFL